MRTFVLLVIALLVSNSAIAEPYLRADELPKLLLFGSEMTISSDELAASYPKDGNQVRVSTPLAEQILKNFREGILGRYRNAKKKMPVIEIKKYHSHWSRGAFSILYPSGFNLTVFPDPGVFELNSKASSQKEIEANLKLIQNDFFDEGKKQGLAPALFTGSGHIHIEITKLHPVTVRNFIADFFNATGLAAGALNEDIYNSVGVGEMPERNKQKIREAFAQFDRTPGAQTETLVSLIEGAYEIPYREDLPEYQNARKSQRPDKYFAFSFASFHSLGTLEVRSLRPQGSAAAYLKLLKMFVARMQYAERNRIAGVLTPIGKMQSIRGDPQAILAEFDRYLKEVGLDINEYREFVLPWWNLKDGDFDHYLAKRIIVKSCAGVHSR